MGCTSCSSNSSGVPNGCKSNGACASGGCDKLNVFDWLANMQLPTGQEVYDIVEVRFKNGRKVFCKNTKKVPLRMGDVVTTEGSPGHDVGTVALIGELVKVQMKKRKVSEDDADQIKKIYRKATQKDIDIWQAARDRETETQRRGREIIQNLGLKMKLSDVEYQGDGNKATFYYTADERVDFRQLIRDLAGAFSIRVEMKQVGLRQEASRLGGVGSCGRELCCSTWLTDFRKVNTAAARYQQLALNPQKLSGQCGKLKCCLNFELDTYLDALNELPKTDKPLMTEKGPAVYIKMDIFKGLLWYTYKEERGKWFKLTAEQVHEILEINASGEKISSLEEYEDELIQAVPEIDFENVVGQDSLTRFDKPKKSNRKKRRKPNNRNKGNKPEAAVASSEGGNSKNNRNKRKKRPQNNGGQAQNSVKNPAQKPQGQKPQGQKPQGQNKPQAQNKKQGQKPQGQKTQGEKTQGQKPQNRRRRPPRKKPNNDA
ncbi:MAG: regulatory iron-sulfur-containing complex subunit RicT [Flavobacteriaceae bacterium]